MSTPNPGKLDNTQRQALGLLATGDFVFGIGGWRLADTGSSDSFPTLIISGLARRGFVTFIRRGCASAAARITPAGRALVKDGGTP